MGIRLSNMGIEATQTSRSKPWIMADIFDLALECTLAEDLTTYDVIGKQAKALLIIFPIPWDFNSTLVFTKRFKGSDRSMASIQSKVSIEATIVLVMATTHTPGSPIAA